MIEASTSTISKFCFVGLKCQKCRDLRAFLGVKSGLLILVRVKDLTFSISGPVELQVCPSERQSPSPQGLTTPETALGVLTITKNNNKKLKEETFNNTQWSEIKQMQPM